VRAFFACGAVLGVFVLSPACGGGEALFGNTGGGGQGQGGAGPSGPGSGGDSGTGTNGGTGGNTGSGGDTSGTSAGGGGNGTGGNTGGTGGTAASSTSASTGSGGGPPCPDANGTYATISHQGAGCGDITDTATACVVSPAMCTFDADSGNSIGASIHGEFVLAQDGTFDNAAIRIGSVQRTGCTGSFSGGTLVVVCGGTNPSSSQYCAVTLTRTGGACDQNPQATINHPGNGETRPNTMAIPFIGVATDPQDGALTGASLVWVDSIEGQIGTGASFNATLPTVGLHVVTLTATDSDGNTGTDAITLNITP
jgi:hypothetical protein